MEPNSLNTNPKGIFNRSAKGSATMPVVVGIERGRIQFFSQVLGETDPVHLDVAAARARGYRDVIAPPSFFMVLDAMANSELERLGQQTVSRLVGCDNRFLLHGDENYTYYGPIVAGDELTVTTTVLDFYDKKGGAMEFVKLSSVVTHPERGVVVRTLRNLLHRLG